jgi:glycosyltransferase involved in cell wall biosynthesis
MIIVNSRFLTQPVAGVQRFAIEISLRLKQMDSSIEFVCPKNVMQHNIFDKLDAKIIGSQTGHLWEQVELPLFLKKQGNPLLVNLCNTAPAYYKNKIATLHDIIYALYPQSCTFAFRFWYRLLIPRILKSSLALVTVSEFSKKEISAYYHYPQNKIHVIYNAVDKRFEPDKDKNPNTEQYLLVVSSIVYHKNYARVMESFLNLCKDKKHNINLLVIGGSNHCFTKQSYEAAQNASIRLLGRVSDKELIKLYQNAELFIFPSLYEGFGIPPLEAQACGCPVIASNAASMPEILGNSAMYFNPTDISAIQDVMDAAISNQRLRKSLIEKGFSNVSRFSWEISVQKLYELILLFSSK